MSGELLRRRPYGTFLKATAPRHDFQHDLESVLWILLWICLCKCGAGVRRPALTDRHDELHELLTECVGQLFEAQDIKQLGTNKESVILTAMHFEHCLTIVDEFYAPLTPLLRKLWTILNAGYTAGHFVFDSTMDQFTAAFDEAERDLEQNPPVLTPEQEANVRAEEARRAEDDDDWEHTPRPVIKATKPAGPVLEPLQALRLSHPAIPEEPAGLAIEDLQEHSPSPDASRQGSPTPFANAADPDLLVLTSQLRSTRAGKRNAAKAATSTKPTPASKKKAATAAPSQAGAVSSDRLLRSRSRAAVVRSEAVATGSSRATTPPPSKSSQSTVQERSDSRASRSAHYDSVAGPSTGDRGRGGRGAATRRGGQRARGTGGTSKRGASGDTTKAKKRK